MTDFAAELAAALDDVDDILGESMVWRRYTFATPNALAGTVGETLAESATLDCCRVRTGVGLETGGAGGRTGVERFEVTVNLARLGWTPTPRDTRVELGGVVYKITAVETENDGLTARCRCERLVSE